MIIHALIRQELGADKVSLVNELVHSIMHGSLALFADSFQS